MNLFEYSDLHSCLSQVICAFLIAILEDIDLDLVVKSYSFVNLYFYWSLKFKVGSGLVYYTYILKNELSDGVILENCQEIYYVFDFLLWATSFGFKQLDQFSWQFHILIVIWNFMELIFCSELYLFESITVYTHDKVINFHRDSIMYFLLYVHLSEFQFLSNVI